MRNIYFIKDSAFVDEQDKIVGMEVVNDQLPYGVYFDNENDELQIICMNEHYSVQMADPNRGGWDLVAQVPSNAINTIFSGLVRAFPNVEMRVLRPNLSTYAIYPNENGGITTGMPDDGGEEN